MKLTHWTNKEYEEKVLEGKAIFSHPQKHFIKPDGLWISVDGSWEDWVNGEWDSWMNNKVCVEVELAKDINLFVINSKEEFLKKFKEITGEDYPSVNVKDRYELIPIFHIGLKHQYDGVWLKSKPFYQHRLGADFDYFYCWDCESICVWNGDKVSFKRCVEEQQGAGK